MDNFSIVWALNMIDSKCSNEQSVYYLFKKKRFSRESYIFFYLQKTCKFLWNFKYSWIWEWCRWTGVPAHFLSTFYNLVIFRVALHQIGILVRVSSSRKWSYRVTFRTWEMEVPKLKYEHKQLTNRVISLERKRVRRYLHADHRLLLALTQVLWRFSTDSSDTLWI